jgi:hypothetical protein
VAQVLVPRPSLSNLFGLLSPSQHKDTAPHQPQGSSGNLRALAASSPGLSSASAGATSAPSPRQPPLAAAQAPGGPITPEPPAGLPPGACLRASLCGVTLTRRRPVGAHSLVSAASRHALSAASLWLALAASHHALCAAVAALQAAWPRSPQRQGRARRRQRWTRPPHHDSLAASPRRPPPRQRPCQVCVCVLHVCPALQTQAHAPRVSLQQLLEPPRLAVTRALLARRAVCNSTRPTTHAHTHTHTHTHHTPPQTYPRRTRRPASAASCSSS